MAVDYKKQYRPDELEPFWPNEIIKMSVVVLCTLAVIMILVILPVLMEAVGVHGLDHEQEPANPRGATPVGIKPEWYFLATYQYLRLTPTQVLGISGKTLGVLSQGPLVLAILLLPFWYRRGANRRPGWLFRIGVTTVIFLFLALTVWGGWPETHVDGHEQLVPVSEYLRQHPMFFSLIALALVIFYALIAQERRAIRTILHDQKPGGELPEDVKP